MLFLVSVPFYLFSSFAAAADDSMVNLASVNCTWPCTTKTDVCQVTSDAIQCSPSTTSQWVMETYNTSPVFTGDTATLNQPCIFAPTINPNTFTSNTTNSKSTTTSNIIWPIPDAARPFDQWLSNCDSTTYCSHNISQCIPRIDQGGFCDTSNQCSNGQQCISNRCNVGPNGWANQGIATSHVLAGAICASVAVVTGIVALVLIRRRRRLHQKTAISHKGIAQETLASFEQCFESGNHTTPAMQQRNLQMRLQQEHSVGDKGDMSTSPPPYSP